MVKVIETYYLDFENIKIEVNIVEQKEAFVQTYMLTVPEFGLGTKALLDSLKSSIITDIPVQSEKMTDQKKRSRLQENLLSLYLRLNGYFVTGFIVHSAEWGKNRAEIDALAVRHPHNSEPERLIKPSPYLEVSTEFTDLLICEVKSQGQQLQFNEALRETPNALISVLRWGGLFDEQEILELAHQLLPLLQPSAEPRQDIPCIIGPRNTRIRAILCSPERWLKRNNQPWFIHGSEIFDFAHSCFCPEKPRNSCSTQYDFEAWGEVYEPIVKFIKEKGRQNMMKELYQYLDI